MPAAGRRLIMLVRSSLLFPPARLARRLLALRSPFPQRVLLCTLSFLSLLASCARPAARVPVTLRFWGLGREGEVVQALLPEFERLHPGVHVLVQQIPLTAAHEKLLTAFVGDTTPDLAQIGNTWIPELAAIGALSPLDAQLRRSRALAPHDFFAGIWDTNVVDGALYGIPWYVDTRLLFYRTDLLAAAGYSAPPRTWSGWRTALQRLKARAGAGHYAVLLPIDEWQQPVILGMQMGAPELKDGGRWGNFAEPRFAAAFAFYVGLFRDGLAPVVGNSGIANVYQQFAAGEFAFYPTGPWNIGEFRRRLPPEMRGKWTTAPWPAPDAQGADGAPGVSVAGGSSLGVFRSARQPRAAWQLIEYLSQPAQQLRFYALCGDLPARLAAWDDPALARDPEAHAFWQQLQHVRSTPKVPEWEQIAFQIYDHAEAVVRGHAPPAAALAALDREVDHILEKRRWVLAHSRPAGRQPS
jgi:multiple sugar transport system substrate-binding protein